MGTAVGDSRACPTKSRRGRPPDPRLAALDLQLIAIVAEMQPIGIRGVFYQCVSRGILEKVETNVDLVERRLLMLRRAGRVPYSSITDPSSDPTWYRAYEGLGEFAADVSELYRRDYWRTAQEWPIVVIEKVGLMGVLSPTTEEWGIPLFPCGGQQSESLIYRIGHLIAGRGVKAFVYVLSDFDAAGDCIFKTFAHGSKKAPGGISRFTEGTPVTVVRLAITPAQIAVWKLPTRPVKDSDRRSPKFIAEHGDRAVELDAIPPELLRTIVDKAIARHMSGDTLAQFKQVEAFERATIRSALTQSYDEPSYDEP
jgi:hypothetical protein